MTRKPFTFREIAIRQMPGFEDRGFTIPQDDLCDGINIIYGPNASGKTTTANAIAHLLWPELDTRSLIHISGKTHLADSNGQIELNAGRVSHWLDGKTADAPTLPPADHRDRYRLALHELVQSDGSQFARAINQELSGGFDINQATSLLGYKAAYKGRPPEASQLQQARKRVRELQSQAQKLQQEEIDLQELEQQLEQARYATARVKELEKVLHWLDARGNLAEARHILSSFSDGMKHLRGDEAERLQRLNQQLTNLKTKIATQERTKQEASKTMQSCDLGENGLLDETLHTLRNLTRDLATQETESKRLQREHTGAIQTRNDLLTRIGTILNPDVDIDLPSVKTLSELMRNEEELRRQTAQIDLELEPLSSSEDSPQTTDPAQLDNAIALLRQWQQAHQAQLAFKNYRYILPVIVIITIIQGGVLFAAGKPIYLIIPVIAAILTAKFWFATDSQENVPKKNYQGLGLPQPDTWETAAVISLIKQLESDRETLRHQQEVQAQKERLKTKKSILLEKQEILTRQRQDICNNLGAVSELDTVTLTVLADNLNRFMTARDQAAELDAELQAANTQATDTLAHINTLLKTCQHQAVSYASEAAAVAENLTTRQAAFTQARTQAGHAQDLLAKLQQDLKTTIADKEQLFRDLSLPATPDGEATLLDWHRQWDQFSQARKQTELATHDLAGAEAALSDAANLPSDISRQQLLDDLDNARQTAESRSQIERDISRISTLIEQARKKRDLEAALTDESEAEAALRCVRDQACHDLAGHALATFLRKRNRERQLPKVFHRARELFAHITNGHYRLEFEEAEIPVFQARDTLKNRIMQLDELSSATRLQLLLAVRVAFVETVETDLMLPLVMDEVLGNSDETRALAVINATADIARTGRQIFYFTAQQDEVSKWRTIIGQDPDLKVSFIDLARIRHLSESQDLPLPSPVEHPLPPSPAGMTHHEYGKLLNIPAITIANGNAGNLHIWHLFNNPEIIYNALCHDIVRWGQLKTLQTYSPETPVHLLKADEAAMQRAAAMASLFETASRLWASGRGKPVTRTVLVQSGQVTETFLDPAAELADSLNHDAVALIDALYSGKLPRFRKGNTSKLAEYLTENGYLDPNPPLEPEELKLKTLASASKHIKAGHITASDSTAFINTLISQR